MVQPALPGFNGATAMKPWKRQRAHETETKTKELHWGHGDEPVDEAGIDSDSLLYCVLQWGHGDEAVEEQVSELVEKLVVAASMGPRR